MSENGDVQLLREQLLEAAKDAGYLRAMIAYARKQTTQEDFESAWRELCDYVDGKL